MSFSAEIDRRIVERSLAVWFKTGSGCVFASQFASGISARTAYATFSKADASVASDINDHFSAAGRDQRAAVAVFPSIATEKQLVKFIGSLRSDPRWQCRSIESKLPDCSALVLEWQTEAGVWSRTMGLAPLLTMPVTRRAPFVAIAAWPGPPRKPNAKFVGFIDMPDDSDEAEHASKLKHTEARTAEHLAGDPDADILKRVAFRFSSVAVDGVEFG